MGLKLKASGEICVPVPSSEENISVLPNQQGNFWYKVSMCRVANLVNRSTVIL